MWWGGGVGGGGAWAGEGIVGTKEGVWKTRTIMRKPVEERWSKETETLVGGVPWKMSAGDEEADGIMERIGLGEKMTHEDEEKSAEDAKLAVPRRFLIQKRDQDEHRYTRDCAGGKASLAGRPRQRRWEKGRSG